MEAVVPMEVDGLRGVADHVVAPKAGLAAEEAPIPTDVHVTPLADNEAATSLGPNEDTRPIPRW